MELTKLIDDENQRHLNRLLEIKATYIIAQKIEKELPIGWKIQYIDGAWHGCLISTSTYTLTMEEREQKDWTHDLRFVRALLKNMFPDKEWKLKSWTTGEYLVAITCEATVTVPEAEGVEILVDVRQDETGQCEIEYEEKTVKVPHVKGECGKLLEAV